MTDKRQAGESIFYEREVPKQEIERLKDYDYPNSVSRLFLPDDLAGQTVADIGAGPSGNIQEMVEESGGFYVALDRNMDLLKARLHSGIKIQGDARYLPFKNKKIDWSHCRFVLMHLLPEDREKIISEVDRISKKRIILDYDWGSWEKRLEKDENEYKNMPELKKSLDLQRRFIDNSKALGRAGKIEMNMGKKLKSEVEGALKKEVTERRITRDLGNYYDEMVLVGEKANIPMWKKIGHESRAQEMAEIINEIKALRPEEKAPFCWADIVGVTW